MALICLYYLLVIAYAEDEGFLPRHNLHYEKRSLKEKAYELVDLIRERVSFDSHSTRHWDGVMALSRANHDGNDEWGLPEYDGCLLSYDPVISEAGAELANIKLSNDDFGPVLTRLLTDENNNIGCRNLSKFCGESPAEYREWIHQNTSIK